MVSPAYNACATFPYTLKATCQLSRSCSTLSSSVGFSLSMPSCLFPFGFPTAYHFSPSSLSLSPAFLVLVSLSLYHNVSHLKPTLYRERCFVVHSCIISPRVDSSGEEQEQKEGSR